MVNLLDWICGCILIYGTLFGVGKILLKEAALGFGMLAAAALAGFIIYRDLSNRGWNKVVDQNPMLSRRTALTTLASAPSCWKITRALHKDKSPWHGPVSNRQ